MVVCRIDSILACLNIFDFRSMIHFYQITYWRPFPAPHFALTNISQCTLNNAKCQQYFMVFLNRKRAMIQLYVGAAQELCIVSLKISMIFYSFELRHEMTKLQLFYFNYFVLFKARVSWWDHLISCKKCLLPPEL